MVRAVRSTDEGGELTPEDPSEGRGRREAARADAARAHGSPERKTKGTPIPAEVSTKLRRIAELAKEDPQRSFLSLAHHVDLDFLREAYRRTRKDGAPGVDDETAAQFAENLEDRLQDLLDRFKSGAYRAPPVRRVHIPKGDGSKTRPIGIPTFADKVLQRAVTMILESIYEQDFSDCSYGFRPGRSVHQALEALWREFRTNGGGWVLEVDIKGFFDTLVHQHLRELLSLRVRDGVIQRTVNKWLKAGVLEDGLLSRSDLGTPQGGVISPLLANVYLHHVMDQWFEEQIKPQLAGRSFLIRYADDFVIVFEREADARRVHEVLPKRFGKYGLELHPEKTKIVRFRRPRHESEGRGEDDDGQPPETFDLLGFTHYWGRSARGYWTPKRKTAKDRFKRALLRIAEWCRENRHLKVREQHVKLVSKVRGHYQFYGITGNWPALSDFRVQVERIWKTWLGRRSQRAHLSWERFKAMLEVYPLPVPRIARSNVTQRHGPRSRMR